METLVELTKRGPIFKGCRACVRWILYTTGWRAPIVPDRPTEARVEAVTSAGATLRWKRTTTTRHRFCCCELDPSTYQVERLDSKTRTWILVYEGTRETCRIECPEADAAVATRVRAVNARRVSEWLRCPSFRTAQIPRRQGGTGPGPYVWDQNSASVVVCVRFPRGTAGRDVRVTYDAKRLKIEGANVCIEGTLYDSIKASDSPPWTLQDSEDDGGATRTLVLQLDKSRRARRTLDLWPCLLKEHPRIDTRYLRNAHRNMGLPVDVYDSKSETHDERASLLRWRKPRQRKEKGPSSSAMGSEAIGDDEDYFEAMDL